MTESEPNNSRSQADPLAIGTTVSGSSLIDDYWDHDYYAIDIPKAGRVTLNLKFPANLGTGRAYWVHVYNSSGNKLYQFDVQSNDSDGRKLAAIGTFAPAGRLYVDIEGYHRDATWGKTYTLNVGFAAGNVEEEFNDSTRDANPIAIGTTVSGSSLIDDYWDHDYYAIDLPKAGRVTLNLKFPANLGTGRAYWVHVYNSSGNKLYQFDVQSNDSDGRKLAAIGTFAPAGRLYVDIEGYHRDATWGKTYTLNVGFAAGNVEEEFNDSTRDANPIAIGTTVSGSSLIDDYWDHDYYAIDLPKAGRVTLNLKFPANLGTGRAYWVHVYNSSGNKLYRFDVPATPAGTAPSIALPQGRSYIDIEGYHRDATWGKTYTLTVSRPPLTLTKTPTPKIAGTAKVGATLKAKPGSWAPAPVTLTYQWLRNGKAIAKATKSSYKLVKADKGRKIAVKVTGSKSGYQKVAKTSAAKKIK